MNTRDLAAFVLFLVIAVVMVRYTNWGVEVMEDPLITYTRNKFSKSAPRVKKPWAYAIETPSGDMYDGEYAVFCDLHSALDQVDTLNDDLAENAEHYKLVPLYRENMK